MFPDDQACAAYLFEQRWPEGFVCPVCGSVRAWELRSKAFTRECADCGRQTSVTAGMVMHGSKLPLTTWFWAAYLMASHSNGISALQVMKQLGLGSYRTAWMLCHKLRRARSRCQPGSPCESNVMCSVPTFFRSSSHPSDSFLGRSAAVVDTDRLLVRLYLSATRFLRSPAKCRWRRQLE